MNKLTYYPILDESYGNVEKAEKLDKLQQMIQMQLGTTLRIATSPADADLILVGGGDGFMFKALRQYHDVDKPFYGVNCGSTGFLLNHMQEGDQLPETAEELTYVAAPIVPVTVTTRDGQTHEGFFTNDITITGHGVDGYQFDIALEDRQISTFATGINVNTPVGSTGYALNLRQPVLPLKSDLLGIVGIAGLPFRHTFCKPQEITITASRIRQHPVAVGMDGRAHFIDDIESVTIHPASKYANIAFRAEEPFEERRILQTEAKIAAHDSRAN